MMKFSVLTDVLTVQSSSEQTDNLYSVHVVVLRQVSALYLYSGCHLNLYPSKCNHSDSRVHLVERDKGLSVKQSKRPTLKHFNYEKATGDRL